MYTVTYFGLWNKYRPVILKMMLAADDSPQTYQLSGHEFIAFNNMKKESHSFSLEVSNGKVTSRTKSAEAEGLWELLQMSRKASELISHSAFSFSLNSRFIFMVQKSNVQ